jgi:signal transduction histidine kinase
MFDNLQLLCLAGAAVIASVLFLALLERRNRRVVPVPVQLLAAGAWLWHTGALLVVLLSDLSGDFAALAHRVGIAVMALGLLLVPSAMLHGLCRVLRTGFTLRQRPDRRHLLAYLPLAALVPALALIAEGERGRFLATLEPLVLPCVLGLAGVSLATAAVCLGCRRRLDLPRGGPFLTALAAALAGVTALQLVVFLHARHTWPGWADYWLLALTLSPLVPALLFAYFVLRYQFMQLVVERALVYGAVVVGVLVLHRVVFEDVARTLPERARVPLGLLEGMAVLTLVVAYRPFRRRTAEALRYLLGAPAGRLREQTRRLAMELSARAGQPPEELLAWFVGAARSALGAEHAAGWLFCPPGRVGASCGDTDRLPHEEARALHEELATARAPVWTCQEPVSQAAAEGLRRAGTSVAAVLAHHGIAGLLLFGGRSRQPQLGEEEVTAVALLTEQLAVTLDNSLLQAERLAAERRALQAEKLSALGLLASSIAHEVKNPLSAIKTIATVLAEDLGPDSPHAEDLRLVLGEVDRLAATTAQLLEFARPARGPGAPGPVSEVLGGTMRLLRHLARQRGVALEMSLEDGPTAAQADGQALREIVVNLLTNSIEAAGPGGRVTVACRRENGSVVVEVSDSGPGLPPEVRERLFEPFLTTKEGGTGLGLYLVGRRVRELGGEVRCDGAQRGGTSFTVRLPCGEG